MLVNFPVKSEAKTPRKRPTHGQPENQKIIQNPYKPPSKELLLKDSEEELLLKDPSKELLLKEPSRELGANRAGSL